MRSTVTLISSLFCFLLVSCQAGKRPSTPVGLTPTAQYPFLGTWTTMVDVYKDDVPNETPSKERITLSLRKDGQFAMEEMGATKVGTWKQQGQQLLLSDKKWIIDPKTGQGFATSYGNVEIPPDIYIISKDNSTLTEDDDPPMVFKRPETN